MRSMMRVVFAGLVMVASASAAGAQQSVRVPNDTVRKLTTREQAEAREAWAMKCLTAQALATRFASSGEIAPEPSKIPSAGGRALGLGGLDASQGLVREQHQAQFDPKVLARGWGRSGTTAAMIARNASYAGQCAPPPIKTPRPQ